jgi:hypothetical protein
LRNKLEQTLLEWPKNSLTFAAKVA